MGDIPDDLVPIIAGAFFVCIAIAGICLYCCYFKKHQQQSKADRRIRNNDKRAKSGQFPSYNLHSNPFLFYMGPAPCEFSEASLTVETDSKRIPNSPCYLPDKKCNKPSEMKRVCRSTSYEKPLRSSCHLQVITEADEENEEENKGELEATYI